MSPTQQVLLIGGDDADAERVVQVLCDAGREVSVPRAVDLPAASALIPSLSSLSAILIDLTDDVTSARHWRDMLRELNRNVPLLVLGSIEQELHISLWLAEGASDWIFRPHFSGLAAVMTRLEREGRDADAEAEAESRWRAGTGELMRLARSPRFRSSDLKGAFAELTEVAVRGARASRCSVWLFDETRTTLECVDLFDLRTRQHTAGRKIDVSCARGYFDLLYSQRMLVVNDVHADPRTRGMSDAYFRPENVGATIDVGLQSRDGLAGCLTLEHLGGPHHWHAGEESFAGALADLASLAMEGAERSKLETALVESEQRFREMFLHSNDSILLYRIVGERVELEDLNPTAELVTGVVRDNVLGKTAREVLPEPSSSKLEQRLQQAIGARAPILYEQELLVPAGSRWFNTSMVPFMNDAGEVYRIASIARDVTSVREAEALQRNLEAQLADSQKNEALARLASHIAHDVNNLLTVVNAHAQRLQEMSGGKPSEIAQAILQATGRGRELTQQVLTFGRRRPPERKPLELGPLVRETVKMLEPTAGGVQIRELMGMRVPRVMGDAGQLHQVLTNLATNALQAMNGLGTLTVTLEGIDVDYAFASKNPPLQAGKWVRLTVADTGHGMNEATTRRIFEPFFSTRKDGSGNGLGLAVVQSIVQAHDGAVVVDSGLERGTSFQVYLPALQEERARPGAGQHLMLVDDHPGMARVSARLLETLGYRTSVFDDPREALKAFRTTPTGFDAVLTDLSMPQMSGEEFTLALREVRPELPVIVSSGMAGELDDETKERLRISAVLVKPWRLEEAVAALKQALGA
jgi:PAS domain S-box-containing protein